MPPKSKDKLPAAPRAADAYEVRAKSLCKLQETEDDWWDGIEVNVPWAAAGAAYAKRADAWLGIISDVVEKDNALDSEFTIEDPDDPDDAVVITGAQLAGLEGFGEHDAPPLLQQPPPLLQQPPPLLQRFYNWTDHLKNRTDQLKIWTDQLRIWSDQLKIGPIN